MNDAPERLRRTRIGREILIVQDDQVNSRFVFPPRHHRVLPLRSVGSGSGHRIGMPKVLPGPTAIEETEQTSAFEWAS